MPIDPAAFQRINSHIARARPQFDAVVGACFRRFGHHCPTARLTAPRSKTARYALACGFAEIVKHLNSLESAQPNIDAFARWLAAAGVGQNDLQHFKSSLLAAMAECGGADWSRQLDADFSAAIGAVFSRLSLPGVGTSASRVRKAA